MKSFLISLMLLTLMLMLIIGNAIYINNVANEMNRKLSALPDAGDAACVQEVFELRDYWEHNTPYVGLSVPFTIVDRVSEQAATLEACAECGDLFGYRTALALLKDAISDARRLERFGVENLF